MKYLVDVYKEGAKIFCFNFCFIYCLIRSGIFHSENIAKGEILISPPSRLLHPNVFSRQLSFVGRVFLNLEDRAA